MTATKLLAAAFFAFMPLAAFANCAGHEQANACDDGYTWDAKTGTCVEITSS